MRQCLNAGQQVVGVVRQPRQRQSLLEDFSKDLDVEVADLSKDAEVARLAQRIKAQRFDYVVLNAGCADVGSFAELSEESMRSVMQTNLLANMQIVRAMIPNALEYKTKFVFVSSLSARLPGMKFASYAVSKAGLTQLYKSLAVEYPTIDFLCIELGGVDTAFHRKAGYTVERRRKAPEKVGKWVYGAMLSKTGMCTLTIEWRIVRRILMTFESSIVWLLRRNQRREK